MSAIAKYSRNDAVRALQHVRKKQRNAELDKQKTMRRLTALAAGSAGAAGMGYYLGQLTKKGREDGVLKADGSVVDGEEDPRNFGPIPIPVAVGGAISAIGLIAGGVTKSKKLQWVNDAVESAGTHILGGYIYHEAFKSGLTSEEDDEDSA